MPRLGVRKPDTSVHALVTPTPATRAPTTDRRKERRGGSLGGAAGVGSMRAVSHRHGVGPRTRRAYHDGHELVRGTAARARRDVLHQLAQPRLHGRAEGRTDREEPRAGAGARWVLRQSWPAGVLTHYGVGPRSRPRRPRPRAPR